MPRPELPAVLHWLSDLLPMSYAAGATEQLGAFSRVTSEFLIDVAVVGGFVVTALLVGAGTLRRRTK